MALGSDASRPAACGSDLGMTELLSGGVRRASSGRNAAGSGGRRTSPCPGGRTAFIGALRVATGGICGLGRTSGLLLGVSDLRTSRWSSGPFRPSGLAAAETLPNNGKTAMAIAPKAAARSTGNLRRWTSEAFVALSPVLLLPVLK